MNEKRTRKHERSKGISYVFEWGNTQAVITIPVPAEGRKPEFNNCWRRGAERERERLRQARLAGSDESALSV